MVIYHNITHPRCVKYFLHMEYAGDVPRIFGEGAEGEGISTNKRHGLVWQPLLLAAAGYSLLDAFKELLRGVKHQRFWIA